jgi:RNA polymerase sigma-70 factor (ECF subfamily)
VAELERGEQGGAGGVGDDPLEEVYRAQRSTVMGFLRRRVRSEQDAEDLTHDTFVRAQRSGQLDRLRHPAAFLLHIARNLLLNRVQREKIVAFSALDELAAAELADPGGTPERVVQARLELRALADALLALPERTREAVILHKFQHLTCRQVAAVMGTSPKTVEKQLARGIAECRRAVRGEEVRGGRVLPFAAAGGEGGTP